jgi:hypothetical protein
MLANNYCTIITLLLVSNQIKSSLTENNELTGLKIGLDFSGLSYSLLHTNILSVFVIIFLKAYIRRQNSNIVLS